MESLLSCRCKSVSYTTSAFPACTSVRMISVLDSSHGTPKIVETDLLTFSFPPGQVDVDVPVLPVIRNFITFLSRPGTTATCLTFSLLFLD